MAQHTYQWKTDHCHWLLREARIRQAIAYSICTRTACTSISREWHWMFMLLFLSPNTANPSIQGLLPFRFRSWTAFPFDQGVRAYIVSLTVF